MKVKAKELGFYGLQRRKEGEVFELNDAKDYSLAWMEPLDDEAREAAKAKEGKEVKRLPKVHKVPTLQEKQKKVAKMRKAASKKEKADEAPVKAESDVL